MHHDLLQSEDPSLHSQPRSHRAPQDGLREEQGDYSEQMSIRCYFAEMKDLKASVESLKAEVCSLKQVIQNCLVKQAGMYLGVPEKVLQDFL